MGSKKRQRTARQNLEEIEHAANLLATQAVQELNFRKLVDMGVIKEDELLICHHCAKPKFRDQMVYNDLCRKCWVGYAVEGAEQCQKTPQ